MTELERVQRRIAAAEAAHDMAEEDGLWEEEDPAAAAVPDGDLYGEDAAAAACEPEAMAEAYGPGHPDYEEDKALWEAERGI